MSKTKELAVNNKNYFAWPYEEQTQIKHKVLSSYSRIWFAKLGSRSNTLFFDCHGGCGAYLNDDGSMSYGSSIIVRLIADDINKSRKYKTGVYYCEIDKKNYNNFLKVKKDFPKAKIVTRNTSFENLIKEKNVIEYYNRFPSLFLVDPFGFNFHISDLSTLMKSHGNEIILNFMFDFINRFINVKSIEKSFDNCFGTTKWREAINLSGQKREDFLVDLIKEKIKETTGAKFVFAYRLCYPHKNQTYYYLIHATNHIDGITLMKDAFASVNNGRVQYLGKLNNLTSFFDLDFFKANDIFEHFLKPFEGKEITVDDLWEMIVEDTAYTSKDLSVALTVLCDSGRISLERVSSKRGSYKKKDKIIIK